MQPRAGWQRLAAMPVRGIIGGSGLGIDIDAGGVGWVKVDGGETLVRYSAGLAAAWEALPEAVMQGVVLLAAHLFERRDGEAMPPAAVAALWRPYRRMRLGVEARA
nr:head-tail connector protein [Sphingomonas melonis]